MGVSMKEMAASAVDNVEKKNKSMSPEINKRDYSKYAENFSKNKTGEKKRDQINIKFSAGITKDDFDGWCREKGLTLNLFFQQAALYVKREVEAGNLSISKMEGIQKL